MTGDARRLLRRFTRAGRVRARNARYDALTTDIIKRVLGPRSNAIDVGCFRGKLLQEIVSQAPLGQHVAFEPNPALAAALRERFPGVTVHQVAVADEPGTSQFHVLTQMPAQSGLLMRPIEGESDVEVIEVAVETIDRMQPDDWPVDLIKIDVEGAEVNVLGGAVETLRRWRPVVVFEHGVTTSRPYGTSPEMLFDLLASCHLDVWLLDDWLDGKAPFTRAGFLREK